MDKLSFGKSPDYDGNRTHCVGHFSPLHKIYYTVFLRIDATAFIYFVIQFSAATIRGRRLLLGQYDRATYTAFLANSPSNCVVWLLQKLIEKHTKQQLTMGKIRQVPFAVSERFD